MDLEKVSRGAAINRGVDVFIELTLFYGVLIGLTFYEVRKRMKESKQVVETLEHLEKH